MKMAASNYSLKVNKLLLDPKFESYRLSLDPLPIYNIELDAAVAEVKLRDDQYTLDHMRAFGMYNYLHCDPWYEDSVYYIDQLGRILNLTVTLILFNQDLGEPFIIINSLCYVNCGSHSIEVLLLRIKKDDLDVKGSGFCVSIEWLTITNISGQDEDKKYAISKRRVLQGKSVPHYAAIEPEGGGLMIASDKPFRFTQVDGKQVEETFEETMDVDEKRVLLYYTDEIVSIWDSCWVIFILPTAPVSGTSKPTRANMAYGRYWVVRQAEKKAQAAATTSKAGGGPGAQPQSKPAPAPAAAQTATMKPTETKPQSKPAPAPAAAQTATMKPTETKKKDKDVTGTVSASLKSSPKPPADKKAKVEESSGMSLDALDALGDTLGVAEVEPEAPKPLPKDIVQENLTAEKYKGRVGEREDSLPPNYRFGGTTPMDDMAALDALSGDFVSPATSLNVHSAPAPSAATPKPQQTPMDNTSALDALAGDFVCPDVRPKVHSAPAPTSEPCAAGKPPNASRQEAKVTEERLERLGDRDDTLPPEYRFLVDKDKDKNGVKPEEKPKKTMGDSAALDALAGDFDSPAAAPTVQCKAAPTVQCKAAPTVQCTAAPTVQSSAAPTVQSSAAKSQPVSRQESRSTTAALDALSDTLLPDELPPAPKPVPASAVVKESRGTTAALDALSDTLLPDELPPAPKPVPASAVVKDKMTDKHQPKLGEDENTIPEEYRFKDEKVGTLSQ
ncbi:UNVERIFIED_CONTAM: hypothetical protein FKN15_008439 [Acipenser sinensis]